MQIQSALFVIQSLSNRTEVESGLLILPQPMRCKQCVGENHYTIFQYVTSADASTNAQVFGRSLMERAQCAVPGVISSIPNNAWLVAIPNCQLKMSFSSDCLLNLKQQLATNRWRGILGQCLLKARCGWGGGKRKGVLFQPSGRTKALEQ